MPDVPCSIIPNSHICWSLRFPSHVEVCILIHWESLLCVAPLQCMSAGKGCVLLVWRHPLSESECLGDPELRCTRLVSHPSLKCFVLIWYWIKGYTCEAHVSQIQKKTSNETWLKDSQPFCVNTWQFDWCTHLKQYSCYLYMMTDLQSSFLVLKPLPQSLFSQSHTAEESSP